MKIMSLRKYFYFWVPTLAVSTVLILFMFSIFSVIFAPMAPSNWNVRQDAYSKYAVEANSFNDSIFPFQEHQDISFRIKSISEIQNLTKWWISSFELNSTQNISYFINLSNNTQTNSSEYNFLLPIFYPGTINQTLLLEAGKSSNIISNFSITEVNSFVGEITVEYNLNKLNRSLNVTIVFDFRYNCISFSTITDKTTSESITLYLNGTNSDNRPSSLIRIIVNIFITLVLSIIIVAIGFTVYYPYKRHKNK